MVEVPVVVVPVSFLVGFFVGLWGYAGARRQAFRDLVAALQRRRAVMQEGDR